MSMLSPGITISHAFRQQSFRHVRRAEVELRTIPIEERRMTAAFFLRQHVHLSDEVRVRLDAARLRQHLPALDFVALHATKQQAHVVARFREVRILRNISTPVTTVVRLESLSPTISTWSPIFTIPRSRPVATVPRPVIVNTSSTGIRERLIIALRRRNVAVHRVHQFEDALALRRVRHVFPTVHHVPSAFSALPLMIGTSSPGSRTRSATRALPSLPARAALRHPPCRTCSGTR